jgi:hypothetical protein
MKKLTLLLLSLSYAIVLGHSILAHDHHDEDLLINSAQFHFPDIHSHSGDFDLNDFFKKYNHSGENEIFTFGNYFQTALLSKLKFQPDYYFKINFISGKSPPYLFPRPESSSLKSQKILYSCPGLRAPPLS